MTYDKVLFALADPTRRSVFEDLRSGPLPVSHLAGRRRVSRPAVSQHLRVLQEAGLVSVQPRGTARYYSVRPDGLAPLRDYVDSFWGDVLQAFANEVQRKMEEPSDRPGNKND